MATSGSPAFPTPRSQTGRGDGPCWVLLRGAACGAGIQGLGKADSSSIQAGICGSGQGMWWWPVMLFLGTVLSALAGGRCPSWRSVDFILLHGSMGNRDLRISSLSLGRDCSVSDHPWEDGAVLPSGCRDPIRCPEPRDPAMAGARLRVPSAVPPVAEGVTCGVSS